MFDSSRHNIESCGKHAKTIYSIISSRWTKNTSTNRARDLPIFFELAEFDAFLVFRHVWLLNGTKVEKEEVAVRFLSDPIIAPYLNLFKYFH